MRSAFIAVLLALILFGSVAQDSPLKADGRVWQTWSNTGGLESALIKGAFVQGVVTGLRAGAFAGYVNGRMDEKNDALDYVKPCIDKGPCAGIPVASLIKPFADSSMDEFMTGATKLQGRFSPPEHASFLDIVRQMDKFYADYRNTPVCMFAAVQESMSSLRGNAASEQGLEMIRKGCSP